MSEQGYKGGLLSTVPFCFLKLCHGGWKEGEKKGQRRGEGKRREGGRKGKKGRKEGTVRIIVERKKNMWSNISLTDIITEGGILGIFTL